MTSAMDAGTARRAVSAGFLRGEKDVKAWREACTITDCQPSRGGDPMQVRFVRPLVGALLSVALLTPACASGQSWPGRNGPGWDGGQSLSRFGIAHDRGYTEGLREGEQDARQRRSYDIRRHDAYNDGDRGYNRSEGDRGRYRDDFRRGFESGYRDGFDRVRGVSTNRRIERGLFAGSRRGGYSEPAYARGYAEGFDKGHGDYDDRDRYDPVSHREYRDGDRGYKDDYGSRDLYKQSYREGFRQGYETGYRGGNRDVRR